MLEHLSLPASLKHGESLGMLSSRHLVAPQASSFHLAQCGAPVGGTSVVFVALLARLAVPSECSGRTHNRASLVCCDRRYWLGRAGAPSASCRWSRCSHACSLGVHACVLHISWWQMTACWQAASLDTVYTASRRGPTVPLEACRSLYLLSTVLKVAGASMLYAASCRQLRRCRQAQSHLMQPHPQACRDTDKHNVWHSKAGHAGACHLRNSHTHAEASRALHCNQARSKLQHYVVHKHLQDLVTPSQHWQSYASPANSIHSPRTPLASHFRLMRMLTHNAWCKGWAMQTNTSHTSRRRYICLLHASQLSAQSHSPHITPTLGL